MARYLVVAHQTAGSPELRAVLREVAVRDPEAVFTLLVPATPPSDMLTWTDGDALVVAQETGDEARERFEADGLRIDGVLIGDANPVYAAADAFNQDSWDQVIVSTLPVGFSRWLKQDVVSRIEREASVPVTHVAATD